MMTILIAAARHENLRRELARVAVDHGLTQKLPFLFEGEQTEYRRGQMLEGLRQAARRRTHVRVDCFVLTRAAAKRRVLVEG